MTPKQEMMLAIGGVAAFVLIQKKKAAAVSAKPAPKGTISAGGNVAGASKPNATNLATRNGTALTPQAPSTIARVVSGVSLGLKDIAKIFGRTGQPTNARPADKPGGTSPKGSMGGGGGGGGNSSGNGGASKGGNVAGIPADGSPEYDSYGNLIGYNDGRTGEFVDLRTPAYDAQGNEIGYYDADGNFAGESIPFDPTTPVTTDLPSMGSANTDTGASMPGLNADGTPSNDGPALETIEGDPSQSWFAPPGGDDSSVMIDSPADSVMVDPGTSIDPGTGDVPSDWSNYPEPDYNPMDDPNGDGFNTEEDSFY